MAQNSHYLSRELVSYTRRVCSLYKRMLRDCDYWEDDFFDARFKKLQIRAEFDKNKNIKDMREAKALLAHAEKQFSNNIHPYHQHGAPIHPYSKGGIAYGRNLLSPDWVLDHYHPLEKAQYPYFFAKREQMKQLYIKLWKNKMIKPEVKESGGHGH